FRRRVVYAGIRSVKQREKIVPIILAAGRSDALPFPKPLAKFGGKTALAIAVENCSELGRTIVVLGCDADRVRPEVPRGAQIVLNARWREGQLSSLLCALRRVPRGAAFLLYPVDHPLLRKATIRRLVAAFRARKASQQIVMPRLGGSYGHPIIVAAALREEFFRAKMAREVVYREPERIKIVASRSSEIFSDFDTVESYQRCARQYEARMTRAKRPR
ncbi:MAG: nucleotidyltransferase family protein, partial [Candidatus Acidiferrum sp.]